MEIILNIKQVKFIGKKDFAIINFDSKKKIT